MVAPRFEARPVGRVVSILTDRRRAPRQPDEGAPSAWLELEPDVADAASDLQVGDVLTLVTWLHLARRDVLRVHPRDEPSRAVTGVFSTRSPDRPNPIGLHTVRVLAIDGLRVQVDRLEALDGTPVIDIKPTLAQDVGAR